MATCKTFPLVSVLSVCVATAAGAQILETETARLLPAHWWKVGNAFEVQTSSEGSEIAIPFAVEYGLTDRIELLVEPVPYAAIKPHVGRHATGVGDVEATVTGLVQHERHSIPALALAAEVKFATARDSLIGSGEPDYTAYIIASKRLGRFDTHVNFAYTHVGRPDTVHLSDILSFGVAGAYRASARWLVFGEVLGNTGAVPGTETPGNSAPEVSSSELVGTLGAGNEVVSGLLLYCSVSYDNNNAVLLRPGFTWRFH